MSTKAMSTRVSRGLAWLGFASTAVGLLDLVALLILLNTWISDKEYGIATLCLWLFPLLDQATDLGLSAALIQRDDHTEERVSTVFWVNTLLSIALVVVLAGVAPLLALIYGH